jgi:hypothetical protein
VPRLCGVADAGPSPFCDDVTETGFAIGFGGIVAVSAGSGFAGFFGSSIMKSSMSGGKRGSSGCRIVACRRRVTRRCCGRVER